MSQFQQWSHRDKCCGGGRLKTYNPKCQRFQEWSKLGKRHKGPSKPTHHPCPCLPYKAPGDLLRRNGRITFHSPHVTPDVSLLPDSSSAPNTINHWMLLPSSSPQRIPWKCHSDILYPWAAERGSITFLWEATEAEMLGKFWVASNLPLLTEPFHLQSVSGPVRF